MHSSRTPLETSSWIRLSLEPGLTPTQARLLLGAVGLPHDVYALSSAALSKFVPAELAAQMRAGPSPEITAAIQRTVSWAADPGHHLLTLADAAYPRSLLDIHDPPLLLYANGNPELLSRPVISIVGARNASAGGQDNASAFAQHLAGLGWCIASGLALGIDAAAHEGALKAGAAGGGTIAILGTGIDIVYPSRHRDLAHRIADQGVLVSEFALGMRAVPYHFPKRNRLVAGISRGVLVVEAARQSGSLITARLATEMGREVFAIPGSIHSPLSRGCHALIRQGAKLVESAQDIQEELGTSGPACASVGRKQAQNAALQETDAGSPDTVLQALGHDPVSLDTLQQRTGASAGGMIARLLELELQDVVVRLDDGRFQRR